MLYYLLHIDHYDLLVLTYCNPLVEELMRHSVVAAAAAVGCLVCQNIQQHSSGHKQLAVRIETVYSAVELVCKSLLDSMLRLFGLL